MDEKEIGDYYHVRQGLVIWHITLGINVHDIIVFSIHLLLACARDDNWRETDHLALIFSLENPPERGEEEVRVATLTSIQ